MAWLSNIAGRAEDLLNRLDHNASIMLLQNESISKQIDNSKMDSTDVELNIDADNVSIINIKNHENLIETDRATSSSEENSSLELSQYFDDMNNEEITVNDTDTDIKIITNQIVNNGDNCRKEFISPNTVSNALEEQNKQLKLKYNKLKKETSEYENNNAVLKIQLEQALISLTSVQEENEKHRSKIQKLLEDKERLVGRLECAPNSMTSSNNHIEFVSKMMKSRDGQQKTVDELNEKLEIIQNDLLTTQKQCSLYKDEALTVRQTLQTEERNRLTLEDELTYTKTELERISNELKENVNMLNAKNDELLSLQKQIETHSTYADNEELESKFHVLTQTVIMKQNALETLTTERNALCLQLERTKSDYEKTLSELKSKLISSSILNVENLEEGRSSRLFTVGPFDEGVTRRVKRAMSTLNTFSIRLGVFLRRYPVARVFLLCYIILLQIWVVLILFTYVPT